MEHKNYHQLAKGFSEYYYSFECSEFNQIINRLKFYYKHQKMKKIIILNTFTLLEFEHALCFLFKISKQTRRMIFSRMEYLKYMIKSGPPIIHKSKWRKQITLYYDNSLTLFSTSPTYQARIAFSSFIILPILGYESLTLYPSSPTIYKYFTPKANFVNLVIDNPNHFQAIFEKVCTEVPSHTTQLTIGAIIPCTLALSQFPQILKIQIGQLLTLPIAQIQKIAQVQILVKDNNFNINFQGSGKLGQNINFHICSISDSTLDSLENTYNSYIDFEKCNFTINSATTVSMVLNKFPRVTTEQILIEVSTDYNILMRYWFVKDWDFDKYIISHLNISRDMPPFMENHQIRVQTLYLEITKDLNMRNARIEVHQKLVVQLIRQSQCAVRIIENIETLPNFIDIQIMCQESLDHAIQILQVIFQKQKQLKRLKIKANSVVLDKSAKLKELYDAVGKFKCLEKLIIPVFEQDDHGAFENLKAVIDNNRKLQEFGIFIIKIFKQTYMHKIAGSDFERSIKDMFRQWQRTLRIYYIN